MSKISILGLYDYDPTLFDLMTLPAGIDKPQVCYNILLHAADFEVLYPDPSFMKQAIKRWADKWYFTFERWEKALSIKYDPLYNYDRYEEYTDTGSASGQSSGQTSSGGTVNNDISAYDSATMREDTKQTSNASGTDSSSTSSSTSLKHDAHLYGNIGVTTSQQMLKDELEVARFNLIDQITDCFTTEFCLLVY